MFGKREVTVVAGELSKPSPHKKIEWIQQFPLFTGVSPAESAVVISSGHEKRVYRRQTLFSAGDPVIHVFLILSGCVKVTQVGFRGSEVMLRVCGAGDLVGMFGLLPDDKHNCAAQIAQHGTALVWDSLIFAKLLDEFPRLRRNTFRLLEERLQEMEQKFRELSTDEVPLRLSSELIRLSKHFQSNIKENGEIHLSQIDLAQLTGTTVSTICRLLSRWEKLGILSVRREVVQIHNPVALAELSECE